MVLLNVLVKREKRRFEYIVKNALATSKDFDNKISILMFLNTFVLSCGEESIQSILLSALY